MVWIITRSAHDLYMHPDDDSQTTLSKWPFIVGDVLLVTSALAIAILGGWQLTNWQVGACVAAVALGAGLFVLPYVVEFRVRVREEQEDRAADIRILEKHVSSVEQLIDALAGRTRALEAAAANSDDPNAALLEAIDTKLTAQEASIASKDALIQKLREDLEKVTQSIPAEFDPKVLQPIEARINGLEERLESKDVAPEPPEAKQVPAKPAEKEDRPAAAAASEAPEQEAMLIAPIKKVAPIERPQRATRDRNGPEESRLLKRAISEKGDGSSTAVSRIITSKVKNNAADQVAEDVRAVDAEPDRIAAEAANSREEEAAPPEMPEMPGPLEAKQDTPESYQPDATSEEGTDPEPEKKAPEPALKPPAADDPEMLFDAAKITSPVTRTKAKKNDAVLTASVFIGIGNKPYLRGSGAGLNWEKGLVMEFQEIGKWRWVVPSDLDAPVELQIYRNDEDPDQSGKYTIEAGQKLEVSPVF